VDRALADLDGETRALGVLLTSEVVTNALVHGVPPLTVTVVCGAGLVRVEVVDQSPQMPVRLAGGPDATRGRGLLVVEALSSRWGADPLPEGGKAVWFEVAPAAAGSR